jgi:hypothetical protein
MGLLHTLVVLSKSNSAALLKQRNLKEGNRYFLLRTLVSKERIESIRALVLSKERIKLALADCSEGRFAMCFFKMMRSGMV